MNVQKVYDEMILANERHIDVTTITGYENARTLLKYLISYPTYYIENIEIAPYEWKNYDDSYIVCLGSEGAVYCQPAIIQNTNKPYRGSGLHLIDTEYLRGHAPSDFVLDLEPEIRLV